MDKILEEIKKEREYQQSKWGDELDSKHNMNDWITFITGYLGKAYTESHNWGNGQRDINKYRECMVKVATLAVAAIENIDKNGGLPPTHYQSEDKNEV